MLTTTKERTEKKRETQCRAASVEKGLDKNNISLLVVSHPSFPTLVFFFLEVVLFPKIPPLLGPLALN